MQDYSDTASGCHAVYTAVYRTRIWWRIIGVFLILSGALVTVTGIGVLVAWLPLWLGVLLLKAAEAAATAHRHDDMAMLLLAIGRMRTVFAVLAGLALTIVIGGMAATAYWLLHHPGLFQP